MHSSAWMEYSTWRNAPHSVSGTLRVWPRFSSPQLHNERDLLVWLPASYSASQRSYPVIYMQDGQNLFDRATSFAGVEWGVDEAMTQLGDEGQEAIIVGLPNTAQRTQEYNPFPHFWNGKGDAYLAFLTDTVKPVIERDFRVLTGREQTGIIGSSLGGLISLYAFFARPEVFGFAGAMSPALWPGRGAIYDFVHRQPFQPGKLYLDHGTREPSARRMKTLLLDKGYRLDADLRYVVETDGEHNEAAWARRLPEALRFLLTR